MSKSKSDHSDLLLALRLVRLRSSLSVLGARRLNGGRRNEDDVKASKRQVIARLPVRALCEGFGL